MEWTHRRHLAYLSVDQLHAVAAGEYSGFAYPRELFDREEGAFEELLFEELLDERNSSGEVWGDSTYFSREHEELLRAGGWRSRIHRKANRIVSRSGPARPVLVADLLHSQREQQLHPPLGAGRRSRSALASGTGEEPPGRRRPLPDDAPSPGSGASLRDAGAFTHRPPPATPSPDRAGRGRTWR